MKTNYHKKMAPKREGPFEIEEVLGPVTYRLKLPTTWKIHNVFHAVLLKPYVETEVHGVTNNYFFSFLLLLTCGSLMFFILLILT
jgi:hypothetical protein